MYSTRILPGEPDLEPYGLFPMPKCNCPPYYGQRIAGKAADKRDQGPLESKGSAFGVNADSASLGLRLIEPNNKWAIPTVLAEVLVLLCRGCLTAEAQPVCACRIGQLASAV